MPLFEHHLHEGLADPLERRGEGLLDSEVEDCFLGGGHLDRPLTEPADRQGNSQYAGSRRLGLVALHPDRGDEADPLEIALPNLGPEHPWRGHADITRRVQTPECERVTARHDDQCVRTWRQPRVGITSSGISTQITSASSADARFWCRNRRALPIPCSSRRGINPDIEAGIAEVEGPRPALVAISDDRGPSGRILRRWWRLIR